MVVAALTSEQQSTTEETVTMASPKVTLEGYVAPSELALVPIPDYEDLPVTEVRTKITKTGDGLSESMTIAPVHIPSESRVCIVVYARAANHDHKRAVDGTGKDATTLEEFVETVTLQAEGAFLIDPDLVAKPVAEHQRRVSEARVAAKEAVRAAKGEPTLPMPFTGPSDPSDDGAPDPE